jgi:hypothetical protein
MNAYRSPVPRFDHQVEQIDDLQDELGRKTIAKAIANELRSDKRPRVLGVYGSWGAGKSYLLSQVIKELLDGNQNNKQQMLVCVFHPWLYEMESGLAPGLIKSLCNLDEQFNSRNPRVNPEHYIKIASNLLDLLVEIGPALVPGGQALVTALGKVAQAALRSVDEHGQVVGSAYPKPVADEVKGQMQKLVNAILDAAYDRSDKQYRLVVFIDDLDRCSPENMVRMLEWLKVHLVVEGCTYVLALDHIAAARDCRTIQGVSGKGH